MKWEDNIKETLDKRTIKPSDTSWNALAARLDKAEKRKNKTPFWLVGIAATVVGILFAITVVFNDKGTDIKNPVIVNTPQQVDDPVTPPEKSSEQEHLVKMNQEVEELEVFAKNPSKKEPTTNKNNPTSSTQQNLAVVNNEKRESFEPSETVLEKETLEDRKVSEIVAQINDLKDRGQTVTDADIEALLRQAQMEIAYQSILEEGSRTVDAKALLQDVEADLQQSFRIKIFEALKNSYETLRTAVAERNN